MKQNAPMAKEVAEQLRQYLNINFAPARKDGKSGQSIAAIQAFDNVINTLESQELTIEWLNDLLDMSVEMINDLEDKLDAPWMLCSKEPPARGEVVQVTVKDGKDRYTCEAYIHAITERWSHATGCGASVDGKVIAWRPKSEPYQGEE